MKTTFIILNYKRLKNLPIIVEAIKKQSIETEIFIWNNNPEVILNQGMFSHKVDLLVNSSRNLFCGPRWDLCKFAKNDFVFILDDDICFADDTIAEHILSESKKNYKPGRLFGVEGVIIDDDLNYFDLSDKQKIIIHSSLPATINKPLHFAYPDQDINVDVVKGRLICLNKNDLLAIPAPPSLFIDKADDITYSLWLAKNTKYHLLIGGCKGRLKDFENKNATYALSMENDWKAYRNNVVKDLLDIKKMQDEAVYY